MRRRNITIISIVVSIILFVILTMIQNKIINSEPKAMVIMANADVQRDTELRQEMFSEVFVPVSLTLNSNIVTSVDDLKGKFAKESINKGQIVFFQDIGTAEELKILDAPSGFEKISVEIKSSKNAVAYQIKPKDRVHLYFSGRYGAIKETIDEFGMEKINKSDNAMYTTCLLRDVEIIGIYDEEGRSIENEKFSGMDTIVIATDSNTSRLINNLRSQGTFDLTK